MLEMSLEEQALIHADEFFTGPEKWHKGDCQNNNGTALCVGAALGLQNTGQLYNWQWFAEILGLTTHQVPLWNDTLPDFAALKAKLQERILFYQKQRLSQSYIVIIGPGRQVRG